MPPMGWLMERGSAGVLTQLGIDRAGQIGLEESAKILLQTWVQVLSQAGTGRTYIDELRTVRKGGGTFVIPVGPRDSPHTASADTGGGGGTAADIGALGSFGAPPAVDTGDLIRSLQMRVIKPGKLVVVFSTDRAAPRLEFGVGGSGAYGPHPAGIVIVPRPHLRVAIRLAQPQMRSNMVLAFNATFKPQSLTKRSIIQMARSGIIKFSSTVGDLRAIGINVGVVNRVQGGLLKFGRILGDVNAVKKGQITNRVLNRAVGRYSAKTLNNFVPKGAGTFGRRVARKANSRLIGAGIARIKL